MRRVARTAAVCTASGVAMLLTGTFAASAAAAVVAAPNDPNTTLPASFTDATGISTTLCADRSPYCISSIPPNPAAPLAVPGNFDESGEAFWMLAAAEFSGPLAGSVAEFALEAAFLGDLAKDQGSVFSRIRFRFDGLRGRIRITHPYGVNEFNATGGTRSINETFDAGCPAVPCNYQAADYGAVSTILRWTGTDAPAGYLGDPNVPHTVVGSPTGFDRVRVEQQVPVTPENPAGWALIDETDRFSLEGKIAGDTPPAAAPFVSVDTNTLAFAGRRSDEASASRKVVVTNTGAAPLSITGLTVGGADAGDFPVSGSCIGATVAPGAACEAVVGFTASVPVGTRSATLQIASNAANTPTVSVALSGSVTGLAPAPPVQPQPRVDRPVPVPVLVPVPVPVPVLVAPGSTQAVAGVAPRALRVSRLAPPRRIGVAQLRSRGLPVSMTLQEGTRVVRLAIYRVRNARRTGSPLVTAFRSVSRAGANRIVLRGRHVLRPIGRGRYIIEVQAGTSRLALGRASQVTFTVTR